MKTATYEIGMVGLGVMGRNLLLNMAGHGYSVAGYDKDRSKVEALRGEAGQRDVRGAGELREFVGMLREPRAVMLLVPAGKIVDSVIAELLVEMKPGDLIIDGGNSHFRDTDRRMRELEGKKINYLGIGISGGEYGARHGPSIMPGGHRDAYERTRPVLEAVAAKVEGAPCVTYLGPGSAGHYVKMVHNGIEYGMLQLIAEAYDLMKRGLGMSDAEISRVYAGWDGGELGGYLIQISSRVLREIDGKSGRPLVEMILDEASQKGTGKWTSQDAMDLQVPVPTIDIAVAMRNLSGLKDERVKAAGALPGPASGFSGGRNGFVEQLGNALYDSFVITYAQGMAQLLAASRAYGYGLALDEVARIWRGGCIIRAAILGDIQAAYRKQADLPNILLDPGVGGAVAKRQQDLREVVRIVADIGIPAPAMMACLGYFDSYRSARSPANLIQALRDYFGSHTYQRIDESGTFHTEWGEMQR
ncbi:MAG: NADP-dependent phosphogluconate dehydrogenase [Candidatus Aureabacteria bacterium]|nr:NADP-dependent phosphogluconate dehydrogenase [Candidatus Auribacterota bacterium]